MKNLIAQGGQTFGPFNRITETETGYICDNCVMPKTVLGVCSIVDWYGVVPALPPPPVVVPSAITMRQARLALLGAGLLTSVDTAINALPEPQKSAAKITWEYSQEVERHNGFVSQLGPALGMTDAQIDSLFILGATL